MCSSQNWPLPKSPAADPSPSLPTLLGRLRLGFGGIHPGRSWEEFCCQRGRGINMKRNKFTRSFLLAAIVALVFRHRCYDPEQQPNLEREKWVIYL